MPSSARIAFIHLLIAAALGTALAQGIPSRVPGSPYPAVRVPDTLYAVSEAGWSIGRRVAVGTLQGLLARTRPRLFRQPSHWYAAWLADLERRHGVRVIRAYQDDFAGLLNLFRSEVKGYILYEPGTPSVNVAVSLCAVFGGIAASPDLVATLEGLGLPRLFDVRGRDGTWALDNHGAAFSRRVVGYLAEPHAHHLADLSVQAGAFHFHAPIDGPLTARAFSRLSAHGVLLGWGEDEFRLIEAASARSLLVHPADYANNLSTLSQLEAAPRQAQPPPPAAAPSGVHTVCFLMSDGDNLQWLLGDFSAERWYGNPRRGRAALGWTVSPALAELAPTVMEALYHDAKSSPGAREHFVAGPSGLGYFFPDRHPALDSAAALTARFMAKGDLRIVNALGAGSQVQHLAAFLRQPQIDAVFYYPYSDYSGLEGAITFLEGKPVIGGYANFWDGFETAATLASRLNARPRDPRSREGYSLIPVHAWSKSVDSVNACAARLDPGVRVVAPDEFVRLIQTHLGPPGSLSLPAAGSRPASGARPGRGPRRAAGGIGYGSGNANLHRASGARVRQGLPATP